MDLAARLEGGPVDPAAVQAGFQAVCAHYDFVTVEGRGGILCPLRWDEQHHLWLEDIVRMLGLSSVLVADSGLGTINSVVLTAHYMHSRELPVKGILFNNYHPGNTMEEDNIAMCAQLTGLPVLAKVQPGDTELSMDAGVLANLYDEVTMQ